MTYPVKVTRSAMPSSLARCSVALLVSAADLDLDVELGGEQRDRAQQHVDLLLRSARPTKMMRFSVRGCQFGK